MCTVYKTTYLLKGARYTRIEVNMSYVAPALREKFETLSTELQDVILERNVQLYTIHDLIHVLEQIVSEEETQPQT